MQGVRLVALFVFACALSGACSLICQFPHCDQQVCHPITHCTRGVYKDYGGGYCGCCAACFITLGEGDICPYKDALDAVLYPATQLCGYGLYCDRHTRRCQLSPVP